MKNNLLSLIDISFRENLYFSSNSNKKNRTFFASLALYSVIYIILSLYLAFAFSATLSTTGASYKNMLAVLVVMATLMIFNQSIIAVKKVFISKDYDILISLPLKKTEIIVSKVASLLAMGLLNSVLLIMPAGIYICVISKTTSFLIEALIASLFTPIFPLGGALIFGTIFSYISAHAKKFSNIVDIFFNLLMVATIFVVTFTFSSGLLTNGDLSFVAGPYYLLHNADSNKLYYLYYVLINVAACVLIVYFISLFYVKVHEALSRTYKAKYVRKDSVCKSESKALFNNEAKRFFSTKQYSIGFIFLCILALVSSIGVSIGIKQAARSVENPSEFNAIFYQYGFFLGLIPMYFVGITVPSQGLVNLEGKAFYLTKTLPIDYKKWINSKLILSLAITATTTFVCSVILVSFVRMSIVSALITLIMPLLFNILETIVLLHLNLRNPKLDAIDEMQMARQSSGFLPVVIDFGLMILTVITLIPGIILDVLKVAGGYGTLISLLFGVSIFGTFIYLNLRGLYNNLERNIDKIKC